MSTPLASKALERYRKAVRKIIQENIEITQMVHRYNPMVPPYDAIYLTIDGEKALQAAALTLARELGLAAIGEPMTSHLDHAFTLPQQSDLRTDREQEIFGRGL